MQLATAVITHNKPTNSQHNTLSTAKHSQPVQLQLLGSSLTHNCQLALTTYQYMMKFTLTVQIPVYHSSPSKTALSSPFCNKPQWKNTHKPTSQARARNPQALLALKHLRRLFLAPHGCLDLPSLFSLKTLSPCVKIWSKSEIVFELFWWSRPVIHLMVYLSLFMPLWQRSKFFFAICSIAMTASW